MVNPWEENINTFIKLANKHGVRMLMVGGGAVNFHGYQRHSADVDFWIDTQEENFKNLVLVFNEMGYELKDFPKAVKTRQQNISVKFSPDELSLELITHFSVNKSFNQAYEEAETATVQGMPLLKWRVLSFDDLITSKAKSRRHKDLLDIQELQRIKAASKSQHEGPNSEA